MNFMNLQDVKDDIVLFLNKNDLQIDELDFFQSKTFDPRILIQNF